VLPVSIDCLDLPKAMLKIPVRWVAALNHTPYRGFGHYFNDYRRPPDRSVQAGETAIS
jgi:hypothetical protein